MIDPDQISKKDILQIFKAEVDALDEEWAQFQSIYDDLDEKERHEWFISRTDRAKTFTRIINKMRAKCRTD